ncbi:MAG: hypothetical protein GXP25_19965 [Planctomycetes bacterium]|nr:hypothetical protein [Planctomycetota bacterium]
MSNQEHDYPGDTLRLLYAIDEYTKPQEGDGCQRWLKEQAITVIATLGVKGAVFRNYDVAPSLITLRGVKMFAMMSQEALADIARLYHDGMIEKSRVSTSYYATLRAYRTTPAGRETLQKNLSRGSRQGVDRVIRCAKCGGLVDFALSIEQKPKKRLVMNRVCGCSTDGKHVASDVWRPTCEAPEISPVEDFFSIGFLEYKTEPFWGERAI